jgi:uncharacterized lipoprotein YajG
MKKIIPLIFIFLFCAGCATMQKRQEPTREFSEDQKQILRRVSMVLIEHGFSIDVIMKIKKTKHLKLKAV